VLVELESPEHALAQPQAVLAELGGHALGVRFEVAPRGGAQQIWRRASGKWL
jgi:hypothetical protein